MRTTPTVGEAVEIFNPTTATISLTNYRLYNASFSSTVDAGSNCYYYDHMTNPTCGTGFGDFDLQFPSGSTIAPNQALVIAITGNTNYRNWCDGGCTADFEIPAPASDDQNVPNMQGVWDQNAQLFTNNGFLTNGGEDLILYSWNGSTSSQVVDIDYFIWGTTSVRTSKTGIGTYASDTPTASQRPITQTAAAPLTFQRACYNEGTETSTAGNGLSGHDETSEDLNTTWTVGAQSMGAKTPNTVP